MYKEKCRQDDSTLTPPMLIGMVSRMHHNLVRSAESAEERDLLSQTSSRLILRRLSRGDGIMQVELASDIELNTSTVSITLGKLENDGYIRRRTDKSDRRATRVYLTEKGLQLNEGMLNRLETYDARMMEGITPEETELIKGILIKMRNNLSDAGARE